MKKVFLFIIYSVGFFIAAAQPAQDKSRMEKERQSIQKELKEIQKVYNDVKGQKQETMGQLNLLQKKIVLQDQYIGNISKELRIIGDDIYVSTVEINKLQRQLDTLKAQYARSIVYAYKNRSTYDYLNFIFSSASFNDALKRITYLKSYRTFRQQQVTEIQQTQHLIQQSKQELIAKKGQKNSALQNQEQQLKILAEQKTEKNQVVAKLKSKESELSKQIAARKKKDAQLRSQIAAVIRREIEAARRKAEEEERARREKEVLANAARNKASNTNTGTANTTTTRPAPPRREESYLTLNAKDIALAKNFEQNRGSLPWPVDNGYVCIHYGTYTVPGTYLKGDNPGITICTPSPNSTVKAVFDGEVSAVSNLGDGLTVMIRHGKYFTIYSNLSSVNVSKGTTVHTGQAVGRTGGDDEGGSGGKVDFLLMIETRNVNPEGWLNRR